MNIKNVTIGVCRAKGISPINAAVIGYIIGKKITTPVFKAVSVSSDGYLTGTPYYGRGKTGHSVFIGDYHSVKRDFINLIQGRDDRKEFVEAWNNKLVTPFYYMEGKEVI